MSCSDVDVFSLASMTSSQYDSRVAKIKAHFTDFHDNKTKINGFDYYYSTDYYVIYTNGEFQNQYKQFRTRVGGKDYYSNVFDLHAYDNDPDCKSRVLDINNLSDSFLQRQLFDSIIADIPSDPPPPDDTQNECCLYSC